MSTGTVKAALALTLATISAVIPTSPARADNWTLVCTFDKVSFAGVLHYDAGVPSYSLAVTSSGNTEVGRGTVIKLNPIYSDDEWKFVGVGPADLAVLLRLVPRTMDAFFEVGTAFSGDYKASAGSCKEQ